MEGRKEGKKETRYARDERSGGHGWMDGSGWMDIWVSTSGGRGDGGTIENRMFLLGLERT